MLSILVAYDERKVIGKDNDLPWHHEEDLKHFRRLTKNHACLMGRKTYESIKKRLGTPLPERTNYVVTSQSIDDDIIIVSDLEDFITRHKDSEEEVFVIGGEQLYRATLRHAKRLYITHVKGTHEGDTFFPDVDFSKFERIYHNDRGSLSFALYERI